ncbi:MAG: DUF2203 domain-containing protein [Solirubrobacteraceae bacterium]
MLHDHHWTPEQANRALPIVGATMRRLRDARRRLAEHGFDTDLALHAEATGGAWPGPERARQSVEVALGFECLERLDIVIRDLERGLVDFPAVIDGREVYLCWLLDEPAVCHWHGMESGFAGRRPLAH